MANQETSVKVLESPDQLLQLLFGFQPTRVLLTGFELGVFTALGDARKPSADVARALGTDPRATDRLLNALVAIGVLQKEGDLFFNTPLAARFLVEGKPPYLAGLGHAVHVWNHWNTLTECVRRGTMVLPRPINERGDQWLAPFIAAMHMRASQTAPDVVAKIGLGGVGRVLDVGGGSGAYAMAFVRTQQGLRATVFDLPNVIPLTRQYVEREGLTDRIDFVEGDYLTDELPPQYDLVFLSQVVHSNAPDENVRLIEKAARVLNLRGQVVIQEFVMSPDRTSPPFAALFALNMLVATEKGDTFTEKEIRSWLANAGLSGIERKETGPHTAIILGRKL